MRVPKRKNMIVPDLSATGFLFRSCIFTKNEMKLLFRFGGAQDPDLGHSPYFVGLQLEAAGIPDNQARGNGVQGKRM